jgi:hypothetical protein
MKSATISEIKHELMVTNPTILLDLCIRLAKFKKENKELLTYLLFEANDEAAYLQQVKKEMDDQFETINFSNIYFVKKTLRKILRTTAKFIRLTGSKQVEVELLLHFCKTLVKNNIPINKSAVLNNLYQFQLKKIEQVMATLHEDLQYDYLKQFNQLQLTNV